MNVHHVVRAWLRAERDSYVAQVQPRTGLSVPEIAALLDNADLGNPDQNRARLRLLYWTRNVFVLEIPPDTEWYEVWNLKHEHTGELLAVNHANWTDPADKNELHNVAKRKAKPLRKELSEWEPPILWGHDRSGPFTIMEGNNRLASYASSGRTDLDIPVFVGLSPLKCLYHLPDQTGPLIRDTLWG
jgi:hypothetical protein